MATNPPSGDGHRKGAVRDRSQTYNPKTEKWVKRDADTGRFLDVKSDGTPFKGVRKIISTDKRGFLASLYLLYINV